MLESGTYSPEVLKMAVVKSLRGDASRAVRYLVPGTVAQMIEKLESHYGLVEKGLTLLQRFYNSKQEDQEDVAQYGLRMEQLVYLAAERGGLSRSNVGETLREGFWHGLKDDRVVDICRSTYDKGASYQQLFEAARNAEQEARYRRAREV